MVISKLCCRNFLTLLFLLASSPSFAKLNPYFYEFKKDGKTNYLLGSFHYGISANEELPDYIWGIFKNSSSLMTETDGQELDRRGIVHPFLGAKKYLTDTGWSKLVQLFQPFLTEGELEQRSAWWVFKALGLLHTGENPVHPKSMDSEIFEKAKAFGIKTVPLATVGDHLEVYEGLYPGDLIETEALPKYSDEELVSFKDKKDDFRLGSEERLNIELSSMPPSHIDLLLTKRNRSWLTKIIRQGDYGGTFVVVGAMHLVGPFGLIELLKEEGFKVKRLNSSSSECLSYLRK